MASLLDGNETIEAQNVTDIDTLHSYLRYLQFEFVIYGIVLSCIVVVGLLGNIWLLAILLTYRHFWKQIRAYIVFQTLCDIILLTVAWFLFSHSTLRSNGYLPQLDIYASLDIYAITAFPYFYAFCNFIYMVHVWDIVALTVERYLAICHPLWHRAVKPKHMAAFSLVGFSTISFLYNIPRLFEHAVYWETDVLQNVTFPSLHRAPFTYSNEYKIGYRFILHSILVSLGPLLILTTLTSKIILVLHRSKYFTEPVTEPRSRTDPNVIDACLINLEALPLTGFTQSKRKSITPRTMSHIADFNKAVIAVFCTAIFAYVLPTVADWIELFKQNDQLLINYVMLFSNIAVTTDAACQFYEYCIFNKAFRQLAVFRKKSLGRQRKKSLKNDELQLYTDGQNVVCGTRRSSRSTPL